MTVARSAGCRLVIGFALVSALAVVGCDGDDGGDGPGELPGGGNGGDIAEACEVCHGEGRIVDVEMIHPGLQPFEDVDATIDAVTVDVDDGDATATLTVDFTVLDPEGNPIGNLGDPNPSRPERFAYLRFALAELDPAAEGSGDADIWVGYTRGDRVPENLTDHGDGTYTYVFDTNLYDLYDPDLRHRLLLMVFGDIVEQAKNVTYDFVPAQLPGPFEFDTRRDIVTTEACNSCHGRLGSPLGSASFHGGSRYLTEACVVCHTTTLAEGQAEFGPMVHGIHSAHDIEELEDFSEVTYPQDLRNCAKCHAGVDGDHWYTLPTMTACGSCHDHVDFVTGEGHEGGPQPDNELCTVCHPPESGLAPIITEHLTEDSTPNNPGVPAGLSNFEYVLEKVTVNETNEPVVTFHINKDGEPLDLSTYPPEGLGRGPSFLVAYALPQDGVDEPADYNNLGRSAGQPASISLESVAGSLTGAPASYKVTLSDAPYPEGATLRAVAIQSYFNQLGAGEDGGDVARHTKSVVMAVDGDPVRREVVEIPKCLSCHESLQLHGGNRVDNVQVCVLCHNPNLSSSGRAADPANVPSETVEALGPDPLTYPETGMVFKQLVHGIHSAAHRTFPFEFVRNRNGGIYYDFSEVTFPGILSNCETCHAEDTYSVDLPEGVLVSTDMTTDGINANRDAVIAARDSVPNGTDLINSPTAAACYLCHDENSAAAHMAQNGGAIDAERAEAVGN